MQCKKVLVISSTVAAALSAYVPPEPWSTLTPPGTYPGGITNYDTLFGIAVQPLAGTMAKRDAVSQINDGQVQAPRVTEVPQTTEARETLMPAVSQIHDGQIQEPEKEAPKVTEVPKTTEKAESILPAVSQIGDGQIQEPAKEAPVETTRRTAAAVSQHTDGQVQAHTTVPAVSQIADGQIQATHAGEAAPQYTEIPYTTERPETLMPAVSQIRDGQIQEPEKEAPKVTEVPYTTEREVPIVPAVSEIHDGQIQAPRTEAAVSQLPDGQVQAPRTEAAASQIADGQVQAPHTEAAASQIHDGQVQAPRTEAAASQVADGQVQATNAAPAKEPDTQVSDSTAKAPDAVSCEAAGTLRMRLVDGVLYDSRGRIGSIVANHQFQFDGPPPQAGAIYAKGWSITPTGYLALGDSDLFYQCLSGDFYNLYDESIGAQCRPVHLEVVNLVNCWMKRWN